MSGTSEPTIRYAGGQLDEFIADNAVVHFEAMGEARFWIGITLADGRAFHINCGANSGRAKGYARCDEDSPTTPYAHPNTSCHRCGRLIAVLPHCPKCRAYVQAQRDARTRAKEAA